MKQVMTMRLVESCNRVHIITVAKDDRKSTMAAIDSQDGRAVVFEQVLTC